MNYLNHIPFSVFLYSKACKEPSISSTFVTLSSILDDVKGEGCKHSSAKVRGVDKYKEKGVFKVNERGKYKGEN